ncbi:malate dehydrogenase [bacterium]|nr:malate dehydrogenase [bacterium]
MNIAVIGAGGSVGREIAQLIISERILAADQRLILMANPEGQSAKSVFGYAADLQDAYAEICPQIGVELDPCSLNTDLIVMAAGATLPMDHDEQIVSRDALAERNAPVFHAYAESIAKNGHGHEIVICISNPNELCVAVFSKYLGRKRVIGMGAFLDSLRFRQEIAVDLGIRRQHVHAFIAGEHGFHMVPFWSGVHIYGFTEEQTDAAILKLRRGFTLATVHDAIHEAGKELRNLVQQGRVQEAYSLISTYPPDIRVVLKPFVTHFSGSKTVMGTARVAMDFIRTITQGNDALISGQVTLAGEFYGIHGTIGVPFVIGNQGVDRIFEIPVSEDEKRLLVEKAGHVQTKLSPYL